MSIADRITDDWEYRLHRNEVRDKGQSYGLWVHGPDEEYPIISETGRLCVRYSFDPDDGSDGVPLTNQDLYRLDVFNSYIEDDGEFEAVGAMFPTVSNIQKWMMVHVVMNYQSSQNVPLLEPLFNRALRGESDDSAA